MSYDITGRGCSSGWGKPGFSVAAFLGSRSNIASPQLADTHCLSSWQLLCSHHAPLSTGVYLRRTAHGQHACMGCVLSLRLWLLEPELPVLSAQPAESRWSLDRGLSLSAYLALWSCCLCRQASDLSVLLGARVTWELWDTCFSAALNGAVCGAGNSSPVGRQTVFLSSGPSV